MFLLLLSKIARTVAKGVRPFDAFLVVLCSSICCLTCPLTSCFVVLPLVLLLLLSLLLPLQIPISLPETLLQTVYPQVPAVRAVVAKDAMYHAWHVLLAGVATPLSVADAAVLSADIPPTTVFAPRPSVQTVSLVGVGREVRVPSFRAV